VNVRLLVSRPSRGRAPFISHRGGFDYQPHAVGLESIHTENDAARQGTLAGYSRKIRAFNDTRSRGRSRGCAWWEPTTSRRSRPSSRGGAATALARRAPSPAPLVRPERASDVWRTFDVASFAPMRSRWPPAVVRGARGASPEAPRAGRMVREVDAAARGALDGNRPMRVLVASDVLRPEVAVLRRRGAGAPGRGEEHSRPRARRRRIAMVGCRRCPAVTDRTSPPRGRTACQCSAHPRCRHAGDDGNQIRMVLQIAAPTASRARLPSRSSSVWIERLIRSPAKMTRARTVGW
jgi:hypothetical protein